MSNQNPDAARLTFYFRVLATVEKAEAQGFFETSAVLRRIAASAAPSKEARGSIDSDLERVSPNGYDTHEAPQTDRLH